MCGQAAAEKVSTVDSIDERPPLSSTCHCYAHTSRVRLHTVSPRLHLRWQEVNVPLSAPIASLYRMPASSAKHKHTQHTQLRRSAAQLKGPVHPFSLSPSVHRPARVWLACGRLRVQHFARGGGAKALQARGHKAWMHSQLVKHDSLTLLCDTSPPPPKKKNAAPRFACLHQRHSTDDANSAVLPLGAVELFAHKDHELVLHAGAALACATVSATGAAALVRRPAGPSHQLAEHREYLRQQQQKQRRRQRPKGGHKPQWRVKRKVGREKGRQGAAPASRQCCCCPAQHVPAALAGRNRRPRSPGCW